MRAMTFCAVAVCLAALAMVASAGEKDIQKMDLLKQMALCCTATRHVLSVFHYGGLSCGTGYLWDIMAAYFRNGADPTALAPDLRDGCLVECIYKANGFLNKDDDMLNENKFREEMINKIKGVANGFDVTNRLDNYFDSMKRKAMKKKLGNKDELLKEVETALSKCLELINNHRDEIENNMKIEEGKKPCHQTPQLLLACIGGYIILNCPESYWGDGNECAGKRGPLRNDIKVLMEEGTGLTKLDDRIKKGGEKQDGEKQKA